MLPRFAPYSQQQGLSVAALSALLSLHWFKVFIPRRPAFVNAFWQKSYQEFSCAASSAAASSVFSCKISSFAAHSPAGVSVFSIKAALSAKGLSSPSRASSRSLPGVAALPSQSAKLSASQRVASAGVNVPSYSYSPHREMIGQRRSSVLASAACIRAASVPSTGNRSSTPVKARILASG